MQFQRRKVSVRYLNEYLNKLHPLVNANRRNRKKVIKKADKELITAICQEVSNILQDEMPINNTIKENLRKFRNLLHALCDENHTIEQKAEI